MRIQDTDNMSFVSVRVEMFQKVEGGRIGIANLCFQNIPRMKVNDNGWVIYGSNGHDVFRCYQLDHLNISRRDYLGGLATDGPILWIEVFLQ